MSCTCFLRCCLTWMLRVANSTPMVDLDSRQNSLRVNRDSRLDLPTPLSPISTTSAQLDTASEPCYQAVTRARRPCRLCECSTQGDGPLQHASKHKKDALKR